MRLTMVHRDVARRAPDQAKLPSFARETASSRTKVVATPSPRQYPNQLRARPASRPQSARASAREVPTAAPVAKRPVPASVLQAKAARDAALRNVSNVSYNKPALVDVAPLDRRASDVSLEAPSEAPRSHKSMMSKVERLLAGVWNSPDRQQSRKALKRAAPEGADQVARPDVQTQPKASSPALLSPADGYRRTYAHARGGSRGRSSALHSTFLTTNELYAATNQ